MSSNFFSDALRQAMAIRHFNQAQLAEFLSVDPAYISRWLKGSSPRLDQMRHVLTTLGWELDRARPDYDPFADAIHHVAKGPDGASGGKVEDKKTAYQNMDEVKKLLEGAAESAKRLATPTVPLAGRVTGADASATIDAAPKGIVDSLHELFPAVDFADNELLLLTVEGTALEPAFRAGTRLAVRRVLRPGGVPEGALVILESTKKPIRSVLRRLVRLGDKRMNRVEKVIGAPIIDGQDYVFFKPREVKIVAVVVGVVAGTVPVEAPAPAAAPAKAEKKGRGTATS